VYEFRAVSESDHEELSNFFVEHKYNGNVVVQALSLLRHPKGPIYRCEKL
jgi:hypothetical protein